MKRKHLRDPGLEEIAAWGRWFRTAHAQRLRDNGLDADAVARELVTIESLAAAVTDKMREEYLARRTQP